MVCVGGENWATVCWEQSFGGNSNPKAYLKSRPDTKIGPASEYRTVRSNSGIAALLLAQVSALEKRIDGLLNAVAIGSIFKHELPNLKRKCRGR